MTGVKKGNSFQNSGASYYIVIKITKFFWNNMDELFTIRPGTSIKTVNRFNQRLKY